MLITIIIFIIILGILVFVHELGHFYTARKLGVKAEEFGFGFPPRIVGWQRCTKQGLVKIAETEKVTLDVDATEINGQPVVQETIVDEKKEIDQLVTEKSWRIIWGNRELTPGEKNDPRAGTIYSLNWIPMGGFVKIKGEDGENKNDSDSFSFQKIWKRAVILSAGVTMNVVLCAVALIITFMIGAPQVIDESNAKEVVSEPKIQILSIIKESPADKAGLEMGDVVVSLDGKPFGEIVDIQKYVAEKKDAEIAVKIERLSEIKDFKFTPIILKETSAPGLGVALAKTGIVAYPWYESIWLGIRGTYFMFIQIIVAFGLIIKNAVLHQPLGVDVAGPVGIAVITGRVARMGFAYILQFIALLSLNLAIINFLPFPALDGGRVLFLAIEKLRGRAVNQKVESIIHTVGFTILMVFVVIVTSKDIWQFKGFFSNLWQKIVG